MPIARFRPAHLDFDNFTEVVANAKAQVSANGELVLDMGGLAHCDTTAICFIIELMREGQAHKCAVKLDNINEQLTNLMKLYRLTL